MDRFNFNSFCFVSVSLSYLSSDEDWFDGEVLLVEHISPEGEVVLRRSGSDAGQNLWNTREEVSDVEFGVFPTRQWVEEEVREDLNSVYDEEPDPSFLDDPNWGHLVTRSRLMDEKVDEYVYQIARSQTKSQLAFWAKSLKKEMRDYILRKEGKVYDDVVDSDGVVTSFRKTGIGLNYPRYARLMNLVSDILCEQACGRKPVIKGKNHCKEVHEWVKSRIGADFGYYFVESDFNAKKDEVVEEKEEGYQDAMDHSNYYVGDDSASYNPWEENVEEEDLVAL